MYMRLRSLVISLYNALFARAVEKLFFHQLVTKTNNFGKSKWLGKPIWQNTFDLWIAQETIHDVNPSLIIECGNKRGGSAYFCLLYTSPSPRDRQKSRMPSSA